MNLDKIKAILIKCLEANLNDSSKHYHLIAATLDRHNNIIAVALNSYIKTHPMQQKLATRIGNKDKQFLHAEIAALVKSNNPYGIIIIRMTKSGKIRLARPCPICYLAIKEARIKKIYYSNDYGSLLLEQVK